jgi:cytokinin riboside 5'-monophosphate phosphoribohydrolase
MLFVDEDSEDPAFDWGEAALAAINKWEADGAGGGKAFSLEWPAEKREQLQ